MQPQQKIGKIRKGWELTKSSWRVLMLDKELASLPLLSMVVSILFLIPCAIIFIGAGMLTRQSGDASGQFHFGSWSILLVLAFYFVMTLITNFFTGAVIYGASQRFHGEDPTVRSSLAAARRKLGPLAMFSLLLATVGVILRAIEERVPFAGQITVWLVNASWNIANFFALPIIMLSDHNVAPLDATRQSAQMVRKVWGESMVAEGGVELIAFFAILLLTVGFAFIGIAGSAALSALSVATIWVLPLAIIWIVGLVLFILIFSALGGIVKAALYYYATTGTSPVTFNQELLRAAMTPKKARKLFG